MKKTEQSIKKLFMKPLSSTRGGAFYNAFPYPTKISPEAIAIYIASATKPGEKILDAFSGSGSTGIAALLSEYPTKKMITTAMALGIKPTWGSRNAVLYEIGTYATFATRTLTNRLKAKDYSIAVKSFIEKAKELVGGYYFAKSPNGSSGTIRYAIWTEFLVCPECGAEIDYFTNGTSRNPATFKKSVECHHCRKTCSVDEMTFATEEYYDKLLKRTISRKKRKLAWIYGTSKGENWDRAATTEDEAFIRKLENEFVPNELPREIKWGDLHRAGYHYGITHLHHFYTIRNYRVMSALWELAGTYPEREADALKLLLLSYNGAHCTLMTRVVAKHNAKDFVLTSAQSGVLYISKLPVEKNILLGLQRKAKPFEECYKMLENCHGTIEIRNVSSTKMIELDKSIDFVFTDPPFGDYIPYAEVNQINELWLPKVTERSEEVIISNAQQKNEDNYRDMLTKVFREINRVATDDCSIAMVFHAAKASIWGTFADAVKSAGLEIEQSSFLDKTQASFKQVVSKTAVQGDPIFLLKKSESGKTVIINEELILRQVVADNPHETEIEQRHCYSLYIGKCMENGISVQRDAVQVYEYIRNLREAETL
ncbi:DNA methyltransferase [Ruminococcus albus]|uniref:DNA methylase N-4/N-6 domain protein n=1 Tax=Ruminococcus albus (strain ATCC 27210 / DSM 20455 / JCM 14654 / NCDO 2250 / 7) TaxID=697329 RepID=E6UCW6_RUMA7|nr:DNA methyltransferase [Ruminococcus albus]ADU22795.1 DNA methylase N-4/N-6 domain protein [Ruminococcus albus 7 = DSM 20455]